MAEAADTGRLTGRGEGTSIVDIAFSLPLLSAGRIIIHAAAALLENGSECELPSGYLCGLEHKEFSRGWFFVGGDFE